jgi:hypothetical protein
MADRAGARALAGGTGARKRSREKIGERAFTCVENLDSYREPRTLHENREDTGEQIQ